MKAGKLPEFSLPVSVAERPIDLMALGSLVMERIIHVERWPDPGGQDVVPVLWLADTCGGCAMNVSTFAARFGGRAAVLSTIGGGEYGEPVHAELLRSGVDTSYLVRREDQEASLIVILTDPSGDWAVLDHLNPELKITSGDLPGVESFRNSKIFHVDGFSFISAGDKHAVIEAIRRAREAGCVLSVDGSVPAARTEPEFLNTLFLQADVVFANYTEASAVTGEGDVQGIVAAFQTMGPAVSILKLGKQGSIVITPDASAEVPACQVEVVDTVAAGDAYIAATLLSLSQGMALMDAARRGSAAGSLACLGPGSLSSRFNMDDVDRTVKQISPSAGGSD